MCRHETQTPNALCFYITSTADLFQLIKSLQSTRLQLSHTPTQDPSSSSEIARLRSQSASKDLEILNLQRRKNELKEDREMLNIALDSKQQELELVRLDSVHLTPQLNYTTLSKYPASRISPSL